MSRGPAQVVEKFAALTRELQEKFAAELAEAVARGAGPARRGPDYSFFVKTIDLPDDLARDLRSSRAVHAVTEEGAFTRIEWKDKSARRTMLYGRRDYRNGRTFPSPFQTRNIRIYEAADLESAAAAQRETDEVDAHREQIVVVPGE